MEDSRTVICCVILMADITRMTEARKTYMFPIINLRETGVKDYQGWCACGCFKHSSDDD